MVNTFDSPSSENVSIVNMISKENSDSGSNQQPFNSVADGGHIGGSNKVKFSLACSNTNNSNSNASSVTNGFVTMYPPNKNGNYCLR